MVFTMYKNMYRQIFAISIVFILSCASSNNNPNHSDSVPTYSREELKKRTFHYFWDLADAKKSSNSR